MQNSTAHQFPTTKMLKFLGGKQINRDSEYGKAKAEIRDFCKMCLWWSKQSNGEGLDLLLEGDLEATKEVWGKYKIYMSSRHQESKDHKYIVGLSYYGGFPDHVYSQWLNMLDTAYKEESVINRMERKTHWRNLGFRILNTFVIYAVIIATSFAAHHLLGIDLALVKFR
jgi:hypothetical protein